MRSDIIHWGKRAASYEAFLKAGADRYLLRHETADEEHYKKLHPQKMSFQHRDAVLKRIKRDRVSDRVWFMVGSPGQTFDTLYDDLQFILELQPHMVGIGPFIPQQDTPFGGGVCGYIETGH